MGYGAAIIMVIADLIDTVKGNKKPPQRECVLPGEGIGQQQQHEILERNLIGEIAAVGIFAFDGIAQRHIQALERGTGSGRPLQYIRIRNDLNNIGVVIGIRDKKRLFPLRRRQVLRQRVAFSS